MKFSANISVLFTELPFLDRVAAAAAAGFPAVEVQAPYDFAAADIRSRVEDAGLVLNHLNTAMGNPGEFGLAAQTGREDEFMAVAERALEYAIALDARTIHCMSGCVAPADWPKAKETFLRNMERASDAARNTDMSFVIEPINSRDRPDFFVSRSDEIVDLLKELGRENVKLLFDFYHIQIMEGDLTRRIDAHWPWIGHFQFASVPDRHEPDEGEINLAPLFQHIQDKGWDGFAGAEYRPRARTQDGLGWLETLAPKAHGRA